MLSSFWVRAFLVILGIALLTAAFVSTFQQVQLESDKEGAIELIKTLGMKFLQLGKSFLNYFIAGLTEIKIYLENLLRFIFADWLTYLQTLFPEKSE